MAQPADRVCAICTEAVDAKTCVYHCRGECPDVCCQACFDRSLQRNGRCPLCRGVVIPGVVPASDDPAALAANDVLPEGAKAQNAAPLAVPAHPAPPAGPPPILLTKRYDKPETIPAPPPGYVASYFWAAHGNYYGGNTKDIVCAYGNTPQAGVPYNGAGGWNGGVWLMVAVPSHLQGLIQVATGTYVAPLDIPVPEGFTEAECRFLWFSQENYYGDNTGDVVFGFGNTRQASLPYGGARGWKGGVWIVIATKPGAPISVSTGTHSAPHTAPAPSGSLAGTVACVWGSQENHYSASTGDVVPAYGDTQAVTMPYGGQRYWHGGAWMCMARTQ